MDLSHLPKEIFYNKSYSLQPSWLQAVFYRKAVVKSSENTKGVSCVSVTL